MGSDTVTIIDTNSNQVIATIPVGGRPVGAVFVRYNL
jgi:YVTN family beta-propeller protein